MNWDRVHIIYFLGIGGIGMSALVRYFLSYGKEVHGYDLTPTPLTAQLEDEGAYIHYKEDISKIPRETDLVIYTPAIPADHAELAYFKGQHTPLYKRAEIVGLLTKNQLTVAVAGTHGKTSISAIAAHVLHSGGKNVTAFVGGIMRNYNSNILISNATEVLLVEADEFDRSFLQIHPDIALISSMDADHLDIYGHHDALRENFQEFANLLGADGILIRNDQLDLANGSGDSITYGLDENSAVSARNIRVANGKFIFDLHYNWREIKDIVMEIPGRHYIENAVGAAAIALRLNVPEASIKNGLETFKGVERRFEFRINEPDLVFIDDYAHHPEEIRATLDAVKELFPERKITGVFQPHLFSRTRDFAEEFAASLEPLDEIVLMPIYPAREKPIPGISSKVIFENIKNENKELIERGELVEHLSGKDLEVLVTMGAGDIGLMIDDIENTIGK